MLIGFLVNDGESEWTDEAQAACAQMLKSASARLMAESRLGVEKLQIAYAFCQVSVPYVVTRQNGETCRQDVLKQFGEYASVQAYQEHYERKFARDEAVISLIFNKPFRSYAYNVSTPNSDGDEISMVSFNANDLSASENSFVHELLHQFGAIDYYYPEIMEFKAKKRFPNSVMLSGETVDDFTRFIIGWDETPSAEARAFWEDIKGISETLVEYARKKEFTEG